MSPRARFPKAARAGIASTFGTALGGLVHVVAGGLGVSAIIMASAEAFAVLKFAGALYLIWLGYTMHSLTKQNIIFLCLSGVATGLSWIFYFKALQLGKVSQVAPVDKMSVAIAIILAVVFLGEPLTFKTAIGALLIIGGTLVLIF